MKNLVAIGLIMIAVNNFLHAQNASTNSIPKPPREGDIVPAPGPRDRTFGISGPGAKHTAAWTNYNLNCTGSAVKDGLIPNLKPLIPDTQLRDTIVISGGDANSSMRGGGFVSNHGRTWIKSFIWPGSKYYKTRNRPLIDPFTGSKADDPNMPYSKGATPCRVQVLMDPRLLF
jgi:hypothetical protein